ncbi:MAG: cell division protein FtsL [Bacillota bacterium]
MNPAVEMSQKGKECGRPSWVWRLSILAMAGIVSYTAVSFWSLDQRLSDMRRDAAELQQQLEARQQHNRELQAEINNLQTNEYVEKVAREQLGLIRPGEIRYLTAPGGTAAVPGSSSAP